MNNEVEEIKKTVDETTEEKPSKKKAKKGFNLKALGIGVGALVLCANIAIAAASLACVNDVKKTNEKLLAEREAESETRENDVVIADEYKIVDTTNISDAYKSGDDSGLSDEDKETLEMASAILDEIITDDMSDYDKEIAVYDWMCANLTHDTGMMAVIPTEGCMVDNPHGVLQGKQAVCVGFATTFRLFMQMMDIECKVVHNVENFHSWDLVLLDDEWYHVDIYSDIPGGHYANFNLSDDLMYEEWDRDFFPEATGLKYNYYYNNRLSAKSIYDAPKMLRTALENKERGLCIEFDGTLSEGDIASGYAMLSALEDSINMYEEEELDLPYGIQEYNFAANPENNNTLLVVMFGTYRSEEEQFKEDLGYDEDRINEELQDAFGDWFEDISVTGLDEIVDYDDNTVITEEVYGVLGINNEVLDAFNITKDDVIGLTIGEFYEMFDAKMGEE